MSDEDTLFCRTCLAASMSGVSRSDGSAVLMSAPAWMSSMMATGHCYLTTAIRPELAAC